MITSEEKIEFAELLHYRTRSSFSIGQDRMRAAERRLGMWEGEKFIGIGMAEIISKSRQRKLLTRDEFIIANFGFLPGSVNL